MKSRRSVTDKSDLCCLPAEERLLQGQGIICLYMCSVGLHKKRQRQVLQCVEACIDTTPALWVCHTVCLSHPSAPSPCPSTEGPRLLLLLQDSASPFEANGPENKIQELNILPHLIIGLSRSLFVSDVKHHKPWQSSGLSEGASLLSRSFLLVWDYNPGTKASLTCR